MLAHLRSMPCCSQVTGHMQGGGLCLSCRERRLVYQQPSGHVSKLTATMQSLRRILREGEALTLLSHRSFSKGRAASQPVGGNCSTVVNLMSWIVVCFVVAVVETRTTNALSTVQQYG